MLEKTYRLLELVSIVICLHSFSGKKIKLDIHSIGYVVFELILMQMMQDEVVSRKMYFAVYLICFIYAYVRLKEPIKQTMFLCLISVFTIGFIQMIVYIPLDFLYYTIPNENVIVSIINLIVFLVIFTTRNSGKYKSIADFCMNSEWILKICLGICITVMGCYMYSLKCSTVIKVDAFVLLSIFITLICIIVYRWQKANYKIEEREKEIQITNAYNDSFQELINTIRSRQHEFNNQIDAIYSTHLTAHSMEELIQLQEEYCNNIVFENRFSKVLNRINNPTLSGFIYTKFTKAEEQGINITYDISYMGKTSISLYDLIEIIGILMDNAVEALISNEVDKKLIFEMTDYENKLELSVKNPIIHLSNDDISNFFVRGYSTKGSGRGIGLSKLIEFQKKYKYDIMAHTYEEKGQEWIAFNIMEKQ